MLLSVARSSGDGVGSSRLSGRCPAPGAHRSDATVDHEMGDMDALGGVRAPSMVRAPQRNLPMAKVADSAKPFTPAGAGQEDGLRLGSMLLGRLLRNQKAAKADLMARLTSSGGRSTSGPRTRLLAL